ncbi:hypothetical protein AVEN_33755-1 [Araneus ventricosus]|uniref:Uncharacterized protein n=1 Tax=Araneus ventricosus TaxID=182803 RepID=A0A4Y2U3E0_ARAVE|nr:hypothetical protein AVEN_33755-1 [Araneus ventricosus]
MEKTSTERSREYRKRLKLNPELHLQLKAKECLRWKERSTKEKVKSKTIKELSIQKEKERSTKEKVKSKTIKELSIQKEKERLRKANWRKRKLGLSKGQESAPISSYSSPSALRKAVELQCLKQNLKEDEAIRQQNEIMNVHWCSTQVTIFTAIVYYKENGTIVHNCYGVISDDMQHDKNTIFAYNSLILTDLKEKLMCIQKVHYWRDGLSSQFKNRFTLGNLVHHESDFGFPADWSFFETSHGKGPADGVGAKLKCYVNSRI